MELRYLAGKTLIWTLNSHILEEYLQKEEELKEMRERERE